MATPALIQPTPQNLISQAEMNNYAQAMANYQSTQANLNLYGVGAALPPPPDPNAYFSAGTPQPTPQPAPQPASRPQSQAMGLAFPTLAAPAPQAQPGLLVGGQPNPGASVSNFALGSPAAQSNQGVTPSLPALDTSGVNPYLNDPLLALYSGLQNPNYQQQGQSFYGDPELFRAPSVAGAT